MTLSFRLQALYKTCALFVAFMGLCAAPAQGLEVLGGKSPQPLLLTENPDALHPVAAALGRMSFWDLQDGNSVQSVVTATALSTRTLLTTSHVFYDTRPAPGERAELRAPCTITNETRDYRWVSCEGLRFMPAFAPSSEDSGHRDVMHCVHFAAYPGADGLSQEALCLLSEPAKVDEPYLELATAEAERELLVPFMAQRAQEGEGKRWDAVVGEPCALVIDNSILRPGSFAGPSGNAIRHYCAIWSGGSGAPLIQAAPEKEAGYAIVGIHLGERYQASDIIKREGNRQFLRPTTFEGRNANVAVGVERIGELIKVLGGR